MEDSKIIKLVNEKITEFSSLYKRMDATKSRIEDFYVFKDYTGNKIDHAISETRNIARWQAKTMSDKLLKLEWQTVVESNNKLSATLKSNIERFSDDVWSQVDEFIADDYGSLDSWNCDKIITRGRIGARWWLHYDKDGRLVIDCLPFDMRWTPYETGEWYCNRTWKTTEGLKLKYGEKINVSGSKVEFWDFGDRETEQLFVGSIAGSDTFSGTKVYEQANPFKIAPFVVAKTSIGFGFRDDGYMEHDGESYDYLDRDEYESANRHASIASTLAMYQFLSAWAQEKKDGAKVADAPPTPQTVTPYAEGEVPVRVELGELSQGFVAASQIVDQDINRGGVSDTESGNTPGSDTALLTTVRNALLEEKQKPFRDALATFKTKSMRMIIKQFIKLGENKKDTKETEIGIEGMTHRFNPSQLGDPSTYRISYKPMMNSKDQNIANVAIANAQRGLLPDEFILTETLQVQDAQTLMDKMRLQKAEAMDPTMNQVAIARSLTRQAADADEVQANAMNLDSMRIIETVILTRRQQRMALAMPFAQPGQVQTQPKPQDEVKPNQQGLMALTGGSHAPTTTATAKVIAK